MNVASATLESPIGPLWVAVGERGVSCITFDGDRAHGEAHVTRTIGDPVWTGRAGTEPLQHALASYFAGDVHAFDALDVDPRGTAFQRRVWLALRSIPPGAPISYGELATRVGRPAASRAVGAANGRNPIPLVLPCHRVIGANGSLTGFGGGLPRKAWLLEHEARQGKLPGMHALG